MTFPYCIIINIRISLKRNSQICERIAYHCYNQFKKMIRNLAYKCE